ncbi:ISL3 family transposase [Sphaerisporangium sp. NPDC051017]|uniref:ISL3 family transposase n=1 Tax=Sphaerisporangium sp. NPDC051017 TaxID=3154636 RepID=UPI0034245F6A
MDDLTRVVFAGLSALVIEGVKDEDDLIRVMARTRDEPVPCPVCRALTGRVHGYCSRTVTDIPVDGRRVVVSVQVRRLVCRARGCPRQTFREQVPGLLERYQRRTSRLTGQLGAVVKEPAGRAGARLSAVLAVAVSRSTALRLLMRLPLPPLRIPRVLGVDDFALKRRHRYATILIDAETGKRIDVLPGRGTEVLETWLRSHPGIEIVCRDGSGAYGEAIRRALPDAVQVCDRWHLWKNLCDKTLAEIRSHSACWATVNPSRPAGVREQTTRERWRFREIKELGYAGSLNLLYRYITQGRAEGERPVITPRCLARLLLTHPDRLRDSDTRLLQELTAACPELTALAQHVRSFAELLTPAEDNDTKLTAWITTIRTADLPHLHGFANGLELDRDAVNAALTLPHHNGRTEGVNTRTKRIMRQMHGRAGFDLLRHRILLQ